MSPNAYIWDPNQRARDLTGRPRAAEVNLQPQSHLCFRIQRMTRLKLHPQGKYKKAVPAVALAANEIRKSGFAQAQNMAPETLPTPGGRAHHTLLAFNTSWLHGILGIQVSGIIERDGR